MAGWTGLEPAASGVTGRRSNQLNYHPLFKHPFFQGFLCGEGPMALEKIEHFQHLSILKA